MTVPQADPSESCSFLRLTPDEMEELRVAHEADRFHDECGVFGIQGHDEAPHIVYLGLYALQHRGQDSAGIATMHADGTRFDIRRGSGTAAQALSAGDIGALGSEIEEIARIALDRSHFFGRRSAD